MVGAAARAVRRLSSTAVPPKAPVARRAQALVRRSLATPTFPVLSEDWLQRAFPVTLALFRSAMMLAARRFAERPVVPVGVAGWRQSPVPPTKCAPIRPPVLRATDGPPLAWPFPTPAEEPKATLAQLDSIASSSGLLVESAPPIVFPQGSASTPTAGGMVCASGFPAMRNAIFISITRSAAATASLTRTTARGWRLTPLSPTRASVRSRSPLKQAAE